MRIIFFVREQDTLIIENCIVCWQIPCDVFVYGKFIFESLESHKWLKLLNKFKLLKYIFPSQRGGKSQLGSTNP